MRRFRDWPVAVFLFALIGCTLFLLAVMGGRHAMCSLYADQPHSAPSYCAAATR